MLGFWIFCLIMVLLIPAAMLALGRRFLVEPPRDINGLYGYRSARSMKSAETWAFAHAYCGRLWVRLGAVLLPLSALAMLPSLGKGADAAGLWCGGVTLVQTAVMIGSLFPVERALKQRFDGDGHRRFFSK